VVPAWELLEGGGASGLHLRQALGPAPGSAGDVFWDLEGYPFADSGNGSSSSSSSSSSSGSSGGGVVRGDSGYAVDLGIGSGGLTGREYLWGVTVFNTAFDEAWARDQAAGPASAGGSGTITTPPTVSSATASSSSSSSLRSSSSLKEPGRVPSEAYAVSTAAFQSQPTAGGLRYACWWAHDASAEAAAYAGFVDWLVARRRAFPDLKVFHYGAYEVTASAAPVALRRTAMYFM